MKIQRRKIYFDYAATSPTDKRVLAAMRPFLDDRYGNPGSLHSLGQEAIAALDFSRDAAKNALRCDFREIIFTSGATEANNLFMRGAIKAWRKKHYGELSEKIPRIIISEIEHESVLSTAEDLSAEGVQVVRIKVDRHGLPDMLAIDRAITPETVFVSVMLANNETGTVLPVKKIAALVARRRKENGNAYPLVHTDASQAFQFISCKISDLGVDAVTLSSHKIYGPKGAGLLYCRLGADIEPITTGGGQEFGMRSGTENVAAIVGFAEAIRLAEKERDVRIKKIRLLTKRLYKGMLKYAPKAKANGFGIDEDIQVRIPNILNARLGSINAEDLIIRSDMAGLCLSSGSACATRSNTPSHVIRAMGYDAAHAKKSVRFSLGIQLSARDVDNANCIIRKLISDRTI